MSEKLLAVRRQLLPVEHQTLRSHMSAINRECGDVSIKWFHQGKAACTIVERGEYQRASNKELARLSQIGAETVKARLCQAFNDAHQIPTAQERITAGVADVRFLGQGKFLRIALILESDKLMQERAGTTAFIDEQNGTNSYWGEYLPHLSLATIPKIHAEEDVLDAVWGIAPDELTFMPPRVQVS